MSVNYTDENYPINNFDRPQIKHVDRITFKSKLIDIKVRQQFALLQ
jgi:hypothetical protein